MKTISTTKAPAAIGPYSQAKVVNGMLYASGQIPINPATGDVDATTIEGQTEQVIANIAAVLEEAGSIATLQAENNGLRLAASQDRQNALLTTAMTAQTNQIINAVNPTPIPAYQVPNPNVYYGCGNGCGC